MPKFPKPIEDIVAAFGMLPGVGPKTAERYAFALLKRHKADRNRFVQAILAADASLITCGTCRNYAEQNPCTICSDPRRDHETICVVASEQDLLAVEHTNEYRGRYHILGGLLSPADGVLPNDLTVTELLGRAANEAPTEIILALDSTTEGEATSLYLSRLLAASGCRVTRLARGLPVGSEVEYADQVTLSDAIRGRREVPGNPVQTIAPIDAVKSLEK